MNKSQREGYFDETLQCSEGTSVPPDVYDLQREYARINDEDALHIDKSTSKPTEIRKESFRQRSERRNRHSGRILNNVNTLERSEELSISSEQEEVFMTDEQLYTPRKNSLKQHKSSSTGSTTKETPGDKNIVGNEGQVLSLSLPSKAIKSEFQRDSIIGKKGKKQARRKSEPTQDVEGKVDTGAVGEVLIERSKSLRTNKPNSSREKCEHLLSSSLGPKLSADSIINKKGNESSALEKVDSTSKEHPVSLVIGIKPKTDLIYKRIKRKSSSFTTSDTRGENEAGQEPLENSAGTKTKSLEFPSDRVSESQLETAVKYDDALVASESYESACSKCKMSGKSKLVTSYCCNCERFMCDRCLNRHNRDKTKIKHNILKGSAMPGSFTMKNDERCHRHPKLNVKYLCINHSSLCCTECESGDHASCKMQHLEDLLIEIPDVRKLKHKTSEESKLKLNLSLKQHKTLKSNKDILVKENDSILEEVKSKTLLMTEHLKKLESDFIAHVSKTLSEEQSELNKDIQACGNNIKVVSEDIKYLNEPKATKESKIKIIEKVKQIEMRNHTECIENQPDEACNLKRHEFEANMKLFKGITEATSLGNIIVITSDKTHLNTLNDTSDTDKSSCMMEDEPLDEPVPKFVREFESFSGWTDGDIDAQTCFTAIEVLENGTVLVSDQANMKLKWFDSDLSSLIKSIQLYSEPWGITRIDANKYIVALPMEHAYREVELVNKDMKRGRKVNLGIECTCVVQTENHLLFAGIDEDKPTFLLTDINCTKKEHVFTEQNHLFRRPNHLLKSLCNPKVIFVSDVDTGVFALDVEKGSILFHYKNKSLRCPMGMTMADSEHMYICSQQTHSLHCISKEGQFLFSVPMSADMRTPQCICHLPLSNEFLLTTDNSYSLVRFKLN